MRILTALAVAAAGLGVSALVAPEPATAGPPPTPTFTVNTVVDEEDGDCESGEAGDCSLRDAINAANGESEETEIFFDLADPSTIDLTLGVLPQITNAMIIDGTDTEVTIDGLDADRIFNAAAQLALIQLTLIDGVAAGDGGAITSSAHVVLQDTTLENNTATGSGGAIRANSVEVTGASVLKANTAADEGGAIHSTGDVSIADTTELTENMVTTGGNGGAVNAPSGTVTVTDAVEMSDNHTDTSGSGGCIAADTIDLDVTSESVFFNNSAEHAGGCLFAHDTADVTGATFATNSSQDNRGGAISAGTIVSAGSIVVTDSVFGGNSPGDGNTAAIAGGAIGSIHASVSVTGSTFENNSIVANPSGGGGAIFSSDDSTLDVTDSTFTANHAPSTAGGGGGAIEASNDDLDVTVQGSTFAGNTALGTVGNGGALLIVQGDAVIENSTFVDNEASEFGGVITVSGISTTSLTNVTATGNVGTGSVHNGSAGSTIELSSSIIAIDEGVACEGTVVEGDVGYNLYFGEVPGPPTCPGGPTNLVGVDPLLFSLGDDGGPTETREPNPLTSPVIDVIPAGDCQVAADQRGVVRPVPRGCDIGAVEVDFRPDNRIRVGSEPERGAGIYNNTGANQAYTLKKGKGKTAKFFIPVRNNAEFTTSNVTVTGRAGNKKFKLTYLDGGADVTPQVTGAGYSFELVAQAENELELQVKVKAKAKKGNKLEALVTTTAGVKVDAVRAVTKRK